MRAPTRRGGGGRLGYITMTPGRSDDHAHAQYLTTVEGDARYAGLAHTHPGSTGDAHVVHQQLAPATEWTIAHNLGKYPAVTVVDSAGNWLIGDTQYLDANTLKVIFSAAFAGVAYLN